MPGLTGIFLFLLSKFHWKKGSAGVLYSLVHFCWKGSSPNSRIHGKTLAGLQSPSQVSTTESSLGAPAFTRSLCEREPGHVHGTSNDITLKCHTDTAISKTVAISDLKARFVSPTVWVHQHRSELKAGLLEGAGAVRAAGKGCWSVVVRAESTTESRLNSAASTRARRRSGISGRFQVLWLRKKARDCRRANWLGSHNPF